MTFKTLSSGIQYDIHTLLNILRVWCLCRTAALRIFFKAVDPDGTGVISVDQLKEAAEKYDLASVVPQETIDEIQGALENAEGEITYEEFIEKLKEKLEEHMG